jgi:hypothetical protein
MARRRKGQTEAAARAREARARKQNTIEDGETMEIVSDTELTEESDVECTGWTGGINHVLSDSEDHEDSDWEDTDDEESFTADSDTDSDEDLDLEELEGQDLVEGLKKHWELELELQMLSQPTPYEPCKRTCRMHLHQFQLKLFGNGSIG